MMAEFSLMGLASVECQLALLMNIGPGNDLIESGNQPLPKPMLTQIYVAI